MKDKINFTRKGGLIPSENEDSEVTAIEYETDFYYWLKIYFKSTNPMDSAVKVEKGRLWVFYILTDKVRSIEPFYVSNDLHKTSFRIPDNLDCKDHERRIDDNALVFVFKKIHLYKPHELTSV